QDQRITAEFIETSTLTTSTSGLGEIQSQTTNLGADPSCAGNCLYYPTGQTVTLEAIPDPRYRFEQWTGACQGTASTCQVSLDRSRNVGAIFKIIPSIFQDQFIKSGD
ncbi:MAG TPA: hypothetical protein VIC53_08010, partial [Wenzhouxiangella sp.]